MLTNKLFKNRKSYIYLILCLDFGTKPRVKVPANMWSGKGNLWLSRLYRYCKRQCCKCDDDTIFQVRQLRQDVGTNDWPALGTVAGSSGRTATARSTPARSPSLHEAATWPSAVTWIKRSKMSLWRVTWEWDAPIAAAVRRNKRDAATTRCQTTAEDYAGRNSEVK
jgi:hypothetical protein